MDAMPTTPAIVTTLILVVAFAWAGRFGWRMYRYWKIGQMLDEQWRSGEIINRRRGATVRAPLVRRHRDGGSVDPRERFP